MSTRAVYKTKMNDKDCLIEALEDVCGPSNVKITNDSIYATYHNHLSTFNRKADGENFDVTVGDCMNCNRSVLNGIMVPKTVSDATVYKLGQAYSKAMAMKAMRAIHGSVVQDDTEENGAQHIRIRMISFDE